MNKLIWWLRMIPKRREIRRKLRTTNDILQRTDSMLYEIMLLKKGKTGKARAAMLKQERDLRVIKRRHIKQRVSLTQALKYLSW